MIIPQKNNAPHILHFGIVTVFLLLLAAPLVSQIGQDNHVSFMMSTAHADCVDGTGVSPTTDCAKELAENEVKRREMAARSPDSCIPFITFEFGKCIFIPLMGWLGSWFITFGGWLLYAAGHLFNMLVQYMLVAFGSTIQTLGLLDGIHTAWEVLRDISNIVIIGMFVFIAISMIIGSETFGAKKLVAHVLIIAVLINFSLLFSKLVIDAGNFTAYQFYKGMGSGGDSTGTDIVNRFFNIVGITSAWDSATVTKNFGQTVRQQGQSGGVDDRNFWGANSSLAGIAAFLYGFIAGIMLLAAALILLYGSYLIAARAILLVFLMLISALAFASWLVPKLSESGYGFKKWWQALINASVFAPLLMILLYASLIILTPAAGSRTASLGSIAADPKMLSQGQNWQTLVIFMFGIGMLYVSFRVANSFSKQIAGFGAAGMFVGRGVGLAAGFTGFLGRNLIGGMAPMLARRGLFTQEGRIGDAYRASVGALATGSFNPLRLPGVASGAKYGGIDLGKVKGEGGYLKAAGDAEKRIIAREAGLRNLATRKSQADLKLERETELIRRANEKDEERLKSHTSDKQAAVPASAATTQQQGAAPRQQGAYSASLTEKDRQDAIKQVASIAGESEGQAARQAADSKIEQSAQYVKEQEIKDLIRASIATQGASNAAGTINTSPAADQNKAVIDELQKIRERMAQRNDRLKEIAKIQKASGPSARGERFDRAIENKYYYSFPLDFSRARSFARVEKIGKAAGKSDAEKAIEQIVEYAQKAAKPSTPMQPAAPSTTPKTNDTKQ